MDQPGRASFAALAALLVALIAYTYSIRFREPEPPVAPALASIPDSCGAYRGSDEPLDAGTLDILGADATLFRTYRSLDGGTIWLFVGYFGSPQENSQIHSPKHCYPGAGWSILEEGTTVLGFQEGTRAVKRLVISDDVRRHVVLYWFTSADAIITSEFALKWRQMSASLFGLPRATAFVRLSTAIELPEDVAGAEDRLARFAEALAPGIDGVLRAGGAAPPAPADSAAAGATTP